MVGEMPIERSAQLISQRRGLLLSKPPNAAACSAYPSSSSLTPATTVAVRCITATTGTTGSSPRKLAWSDEYNNDRRHSTNGMLSPVDYELVCATRPAIEHKVKPHNDRTAA